MPCQRFRSANYLGRRGTVCKITARLSRVHICDVVDDARGRSGCACIDNVERHDL